ncbi:hypothetical protein HUT16_30130 [Kitasatospora sp. NA04385]|uniref:hypothetical protein n=1 Tax=Kitasatospora sp. NA04385 TaxID=2742135 RepID=UPI001590837C|nr:hypothetical protein [Kitasatospora sp. NA04385]QKW22783.1 hypothetical protein HUT16_30130 [Kitasatospora sp. NA04385]
MNKTTGRIAKTLIAGFVAAVSVVGLTGSASANNVSALGRGSTLNGGDSIVKFGAGGQPSYELRMQTDGNLVEYRWNNGSVDKVCWSSNSSGNGNSHATFQNDGNFVVYRNSDNKALWASNTVGVQGSTVSVAASGSFYVGYQQINAPYC